MNPVAPRGEDQGEGEAAIGIRVSCKDAIRGGPPHHPVAEQRALLSDSGRASPRPSTSLYGAFSVKGVGVSILSVQRPGPGAAGVTATSQAATAPGPGRWVSERIDNEPRGARHCARSLAPRPCIRLDPLGTRTMKQSFASAAGLRGGGPILRPARSHGLSWVTATSDRYRRPVAIARSGPELSCFHSFCFHSLWSRLWSARPSGRGSQDDALGDLADRDLERMSRCRHPEIWTAHARSHKVASMQLWPPTVHALTSSPSSEPRSAIPRPISSSASWAPSLQG